MISLLLPTRRRPAEFTRFLDSVYATAGQPDQVEVIARTDDDDQSYRDLVTAHPVTWISGPRTTLSVLWNECYQHARGEILGHMGDDIVFRTPGWDEIVTAAFAQYPDHIVFVHGDDMGNPAALTFGTHGFIHRLWAQTVGYFVPPYFSSDYNDSWLNEVANALHRRHFVDIKTEHMHFVHSKGPRDEVHEERLARGERDGVVEMYQRLAPERARDIAKLRKVIHHDA